MYALCAICKRYVGPAVAGNPEQYHGVCVYLHTEEMRAKSLAGERRINELQSHAQSGRT